MTWNIKITGPAQKQLRRFPEKDQARVKTALTSMGDDPFSGDIVRLRAQPTAWRRRVGNYRILFDVYPEQLLVAVMAIYRRTSTTY